MFRSRLLLADTFLTLLNNYRVLHLGGGFGSGKTAFAHFLAYHEIMRGKYRYFVSNCRSVWRDKLEDVWPLPGQRAVDTVVLLDEGGLFLKSFKDAEDYLAFTRKLNVLVLIPSVNNPVASVRFLRVQRTLDLAAFGFPAWVYSWQLSADKVLERGWFLWLFPSAIFGIYDTDDMPSDGGNLDAWLSDYVAILRALDAQDDTQNPYSYEAGSLVAKSRLAEKIGAASLALPLSVPTSRGNPEMDSAGRDYVYELSAVADRLEQAAELASVSAEKSKRRRRH